MFIDKPIFWDYLITDEDGWVCGIREDSPEEVKEAYEVYIKKRRDNPEIKF